MQVFQANDGARLSKMHAQAGDTVQTIGTTDSSVTSSIANVSVCVVCCSTASMPHDAVLAIANAMKSIATVRTILLSETGCESTEGLEVVVVPYGTKLSKIRRLANLVTTDLFCICDPDLTVDEDACRSVLNQSVTDIRAGKESVTFGIVDGRDDGTLLSRVIAVDKWWSHHVLRRFLWAMSIGITLPGQFLIISSGLLRSLEPTVDTYLDDLYLGWVAKQRNLHVHRVPVIVGNEDPRSSWSSLLTQRCRWMRGLMCLFGHLYSYPSALVLLGIHFLVYHGLPIAAMIMILFLCATNPLAGFCVFFGIAAIMSRLSGQSYYANVVFLGVFPILHVFATLLWWAPVSRTTLTRR